MRKLVLTLACAMLTVCYVFADPVPQQTAQTVALNFFKNNSSNGTTAIAAVLKYKRTAADGTVDFYVFDITPNGFVIVSGDDNAEPVIGYSPESSFDPSVTDIGLTDWMNSASLKIRYIIENKISKDPVLTQQWQNYTNGIKVNPTRAAVSPLLTTTWNQSPNYNAYCPLNTSSNQRCVTGCVATAMAQIMKYWNYPATGTGSYSYTPSGYTTQSVNFGATTYNWGSMPNSVNSTNYDAVAVLSYHCGVAVAMHYGTASQGGSGASVLQSEAGGSTRPCAQRAYWQNFGYNQTAMQGVHQSSYTAQAWVDLIKSELNAARPLQYAGWDPSGGGHTWVCDGYDANSMFHMNWGWGGYANGYFSLTNLNAGSYTFSQNDEALIGIQPAGATPPTCGVPSNLASSGITDKTASVSWSTVANATSYSLQYKTNSASTWNTVSATNTSYGFTNLTASTTYNYRVLTNCASGASAYSTTASFTTTATPVSCGVPANLTSSAITDKTATVSWGAVPGAVNYSIQYKTAAASTWNTLSATNTSYGLASLTPSTTYNYRVATNCSGGASTYSTTSSFTTSATPVSCGVPTGLSSSAITDKTATVSWGIVSGATSYSLQYKASSASTWSTLSATNSSYGLTSLTATTSYDYRVATNCSGGASAYSTTSSFITSATPVSCGTPSGLSATNITANAATLGWGTVTGATSYNLQYKATSASTWSTLAVTNTSYTFPNNLSATTSYDYRVQTICPSGPSSYSVNSSFTTSGGAPSAYCTSKGNSQAFEYIKTVTFGTFTNSSTSNAGYGNFTAMTVPLGATQSFTLTPGFVNTSYIEYWAIYIDYNKNGVFTDAGEKVYSSPGSKVAVSGSFTVPAGSNGTTRMRIIMQFGSSISTSCGSYSYGETEDYTVSFNGVSSVTVEGINGYENIQATPSVYPNPVSDVVNVILTPVEDLETTVEILTVTGQTVLSYHPQAGDREARINMSALPAGVYMVRTGYGNERWSSEKIVKD